MARDLQDRRAKIDEAAARWRDSCLVEDGSLLYDDEQVWTAESLATLYQNIIESPLAGEGSFLDKLEKQIGGDTALALLAAEAVLVYYLFAWKGSVGVALKQQRVRQVLALAGREPPTDAAAWEALSDDGIGHPGQYFLFRPDVQLGFLLDFARRLKALEPEERRALLGDSWRLRDFADGATDGETASAMRHIILHLLRPDDFERISSSEHKQAIATTYAGLSDAELDDIDEQLLAIRKRLVDLLGRSSEELDFYEPPLAGTWGSGRSDGRSDAVDVLELKKQVVLYGPPGTSKTYEAKQLAEQIIRRQAIKLWKPVTYFRRQDRVEELIDAHVRRVQLHPAYSYEEFIRGLRLRGGDVSYENGYLLRLVEEINSEQRPDDELPLPWVLILDELNRADLSRVFGEAFSVLEDRNSPVELVGQEAGESPVELRLPENLYVIGTMNLIDQSLEQIDFALRRRFLWRWSGFDAERLRDVLFERWAALPIRTPYPWDRVSSEFERFVDHAARLNEEIATSPLLGRDYEVGHTYFFDVVGLLANAEYMHRKTKARQFLWRAKGEPLPPVLELWEMSLKPLLEQYLQGVDPDARSAEVTRLGAVFIQGGS